MILKEFLLNKIWEKISGCSLGHITHLANQMNLFEMNAKNIVKETTCFISLSSLSLSLSCIDLVITNSSSNFQNTKAISTGLSDFHKMVVSVLKRSFHRSAPKEVVYRDYKILDRVIFKRELEDKLNQQINEYKHFELIF